MSENLFGLTVAADKGLDDLQCQRLLSENRKYQEVMLQYRCALKALESRLEILNEEFSLQHDRNPIDSMKSRFPGLSGNADREVVLCFLFQQSQDGRLLAIALSNHCITFPVTDFQSAFNSHSILVVFILTFYKVVEIASL